MNETFTNTTRRREDNIRMDLKVIGAILGIGFNLLGMGFNAEPL
jgi:hypothetical protein